MAKILVAASPEPRAMLQRILAGHELVCAETMAHAEQLLNEQSFDEIVCTILFDESRMFDLLRLAKSRPEWQRIPFVCARLIADILNSPVTQEAVAFTCNALGAAAFFDIAHFKDDPEREMREAIEQFLDT